MNIENLSSGYNGIPVFKHVNLEIQPGDFIGILGANGTGKSTLLSTLAGMIKPLEGMIKVEGVPTISGNAQIASHQGILLVPQTGRNIPTLSVRDNLILAGWSLDTKKERLNRIDKILSQSPFDQIGHERHTDASMLSGGQQLLLSLAAAAMCDKKIIMLDEPTSGADKSNIKEIIKHLIKYKASGMTMIIVEQIPWVVYTICTRICEMAYNGGRYSTLIELSKNEIVYRKTQIELLEDFEYDQ